MARIYMGASSRVDSEVLEAVSHLPDDCFVFAEFSIGRNIDWFISRAIDDPNDDHLSPMIVTELKRVSGPVRGDVNGIWSMQNATGEWAEMRSANERDLNPYFQAVNSANALGEWLWNNQRRYASPSSDRPATDFKLWPDLLILPSGPTRLAHELPLAPTSRYGRWFFNIEEWLTHLQAWDPRRGCRLSRAELERLGDVLGLRPIASTPAAPAAEAALPPGLGELAAWLAGIETRLRRLEAQARMDAANTSERPGTPPLQPGIRRPLQLEERTALLEAVAEVRNAGRSRALPGVLEQMNARLGYRLQDTHYNGFVTARAMFEQARVDGLVNFGPNSGPNPTIYLNDETVPS